MPNLVGIGLSQVPTNSMLGGLAYQDPEHASIKDLDLKNLSQINSEIADTAVDVFIYDTSKDSDGGAWRKRTQDTSWYNETLGTAIRGTRREFPAVAVIVAEAHEVTIYDGDDPDLPMWMVFNVLGTNSGTPSMIGWPSSANTIMSSISAKNGIIVFGSDGGITEALLIKDDFEILYGPTGWEFGGQWSISQRNSKPSNFVSGTSFKILNNNVNDVAMTVLSNAPIDDTTGLPVPTIAVATGNGVTVIKDDRSVVDITASAGSNYSNADFISISSDGFLVFPQHGSGNNGEYSLMTIPIPDADRTTQTNSGNASDKFIFNDPNAALTSLPHGLGVSQNGAIKIPGTQFLNYPNGLAILDENLTSSSNAMIAYIKSNFNTGWMHGNIRGAFLSDTDTTNKTNGQTESDRSANNNALTVYGTITKSAVATGAELVSYGPFTDSNYLRQSYNSDMNFGTGVFSVCIWIKPDTNTPYMRIINRVTNTNNNRWELYTDNNQNNIVFYTRNASSQSSTTVSGDAIPLDIWTHVCGVRESNGDLKLYLNGQLRGTSTIGSGSNPSVRDLTSTTANLLIGNAVDWDPNNAFDGQLALVRISKSAPSAEQVKKMYEDEKCLFHENAKATLYGSSDAVTALSFDDTTNLLHVGTSAGRSEFQGLRRINNTTTAVTTAISASNGLVAEQ